MELNVATELKIAGKVSSAHMEQQLDAVEFMGRELAFTKPAVLDISYSFDGEGISITGTLFIELLMYCAKCNAEYTLPFSVDFSERFLKVSDSEAEELDCYPYMGDTIQLDKMVLDLVYLNTPLYGLCKPDCRGLCPSCGANLNNTQCSCSNVAENANFASLKELAQLLKYE